MSFYRFQYVQFNQGELQETSRRGNSHYIEHKIAPPLPNFKVEVVWAKTFTAWLLGTQSFA
jgi:hypothetical protein